MGNYLSSPNASKHREDGQLSSLRYAVCAMQGWRVSMEDAHLVHLFEHLDSAGGPVALFCVFDGHGGAQVAQFVARHMVDELLKLIDFQQGHFDSAFRSVYIALDALLRQDIHQSELEWFSRSENYYFTNNEDSTRLLHPLSCPYPSYPLITPASITMRFSQSSITTPHQNQRSKKFRPSVRLGRTRRSYRNKVTYKKTRRTKLSSSGGDDISSCDSHNNNNQNNDDNPALALLQHHTPTDITNLTPPSSFECTGAIVSEEDPLHHFEKDPLRQPHSALASFNRCSLQQQSDPSSSSSTVVVPEDYDLPEERSSTSSGPHFQKQDTCTSFHSPTLTSGANTNTRTSIHDNLEESCNPKNCLRNNEDSDNNESPTTGTSVNHQQSSQTTTTTPGVLQGLRSLISSLMRFGGIDRSTTTASHGLAMLAGCTAISVFVTKSQMIVANAGDSRAVLCRGTHALELSKDHKPTLPEEKARIYTAGGWLEMGRVNGNLNLSRALGDLIYKVNSTLPPDKQIVSAVPDVMFADIQEDDEFLIIGCDGIWESSTSQEIVDFIRGRIDKAIRLGDVLESLFEELLSPNPTLFEFGCDNMTAILIDLHPDRRTNLVDTKNGEYHQMDQQGKLDQLQQKSNPAFCSENYQHNDVLNHSNDTNHLPSITAVEKKSLC